MGRLTLVTGGARSGKSSYAEQQIGRGCENIAYIATARALDAEMEDRVARHRLQRPATWQTFEEPLQPSLIIHDHKEHYDGFLLDCLTVLTTNIILQDSAIDWEQPTVASMAQIEQQVLKEIDALLATHKLYAGHLFAVTNEVGLGIVPGTPLARFFRDCSGRVNQRMAAAADEVVLVVSGIPVQVKGGGVCV